MNNATLPDDYCQQWELLLLLLSSEEKKIDRTNDSEIDTMNYFLNNEGIRHIFSKWLNEMKESFTKKILNQESSLKSDAISQDWREKGNDKFRANNIEESYRCYTKSVIYAYQNSSLYTLALGNRSAALVRLKKFQECLSDIKLSIASGYPEALKHKLLLRRADCHISLQQHKDATEALIAATSYYAKLQRSAAYDASFESRVQELKKKLKEKSNEEPPERDVLPDLYLGENVHYPSASNAIELKKNDRVGRHVVARQPMKRGDVLLIEEPYACVTLPSELKNATCENCCTPAINIVPCCSCTRSWYCSEACRAKAFQSFHRWECVGSQTDLFKTIGIAHLALRVLLVSASAGFPELLQPNESSKTGAELFRGYADVDTVEIYARDTPPFYRMFNLVTNFDKMNNTDYIQYALSACLLHSTKILTKQKRFILTPGLRENVQIHKFGHSLLFCTASRSSTTATMLTLYLESRTSFFDYLSLTLPCKLVEAKLFAGALILRSLGQLVCNGHAALSLTTTEECNERTITEREVRRATAIYPSAAMMNHSCDPNIVNTFYNNKLIVRCSRGIQEGAEVYNCYGPHRARETTVERRAVLRAQYSFDCACSACTDNRPWDFVSLFSAYACRTCKAPVIQPGKTTRCKQCKSKFKFERAIATVETAEEYMLQADNCISLEERCEKVLAAYKLKQEVWYRYHTSLRSDADKLARIYADMGDFGKSIELIKRNIHSLEYQFGSYSVEVTHELRKLSDVMLGRLTNTSDYDNYREWCLESHKIIKKTIQLMEFNYGPWEMLVKKLKEQETIMASLLAQTQTSEPAKDVPQNLQSNLNN